MNVRRASTLLALCFAFPLLAFTATSITPSSGPTSGGTLVTIKGEFANWPYNVYFGQVQALDTRRVDEHTITAITPPHLPGPQPVRLFEYDFMFETDLTYVYEGPVPEEAFARILLPVFTPPAFGAHGAEFRTELEMSGRDGEAIVYGLLEKCELPCVEPSRDPVRLYRWAEPDLVPNGSPGRFIFVDQREVRHVAAHLRAYDVSREATYTGTELPVVRFDTEADPVIVLPAVPTDPRFRNMLRVYSVAPMTVTVTAGEVTQSLQLAPGADMFAPAYGVWTDFPVGVGEVRVTVKAAVAGNPPAYVGKIWAFATVTNNDTQVITTVTPQP